MALLGLVFVTACSDKFKDNLAREIAAGKQLEMAAEATTADVHKTHGH